jgi:hypothetical protein
MSRIFWFLDGRMEFNDFVDSEDEILTIMVAKVTVDYRVEPESQSLQSWCVRRRAALYSHHKSRRFAMHRRHTPHRSILVVAIALSFASPILCQQPVGAPADRTNLERARQQEMSSREWQLRNFGKPGPPLDKRQLEALMAQTQEDFTRILTLHNEIARAIASPNELDYRFISDAAGEIKKRATRLQTTLVLRPSSEEQDKKPEEFSGAQLKIGLIKLCEQIKSFVTNPIIETPNTVDAKQLTRAREDLESVVQLSGQIKKDAGRLSKNKE